MSQAQPVTDCIMVIACYIAVHHVHIQFRLADKDGNGELNLKEVTELVQRLNIKLSKHHIKKKVYTYYSLLENHMHFTFLHTARILSVF
jgi:Ca2+-binding EF-hand superfamily protein